MLQVGVGGGTSCQRQEPGARSDRRGLLVDGESLVRKWRLAGKSEWKEVLVRPGKLRIDRKGRMGTDRRQERPGLTRKGQQVEMVPSEGRG